MDGWWWWKMMDGWLIDWWCFGFAVFYNAFAFDSDVSKWDTSRVTTMEASKLSCLYCVVETYKPNHFFFFSSHPPTIRPPPQCFLEPLHLTRTFPNGTSARLWLRRACSQARRPKTFAQRDSMEYHRHPCRNARVVQVHAKRAGRGRSAPAGMGKCRRTSADNAQRGTRATSRAELPPATTAQRVFFRRSLEIHPVILAPQGGTRTKSACHSVCHVSQAVTVRTLMPQCVKNAR